MWTTLFSNELCTTFTKPCERVAHESVDLVTFEKVDQKPIQHKRIQPISTRPAINLAVYLLLLLQSMCVLYGFHAPVCNYIYVHMCTIYAFTKSVA